MQCLVAKFSVPYVHTEFIRQTDRHSARNSLFISRNSLKPFSTAEMFSHLPSWRFDHRLLPFLFLFSPLPLLSLSSKLPFQFCHHTPGLCFWSSQFSVSLQFFSLVPWPLVVWVEHGKTEIFYPGVCVCRGVCRRNEGVINESAMPTQAAALASYAQTQMGQHSMFCSLSSCSFQ